MSDIRQRPKNNYINTQKDAKDTDNATNTERKLSLNRNTSLKILSRMVVIFALLIVVYFTSNDHKIKTFAKQTELLPGKGLVVECSQSYKDELDKFEGCAPKLCKRFVTDKVISLREADELLHVAKKGLKIGGSSGGASILDLHSGALSLGKHFINIYKKAGTKNLFSDNDFNLYRVVKEKVKHAVTHHFGINPSKIYLTHPTFFSQITSKKAITIHDEYWHPHVDKDTYRSFHYTTLLYLSDYNIDFKGGRFIFIDEKMNRTVEPRKARLSMFTSGSENLHYVEKVTSGVRYAMTISFTCDKQFAIEDPSSDKYLN